MTTESANPLSASLEDYLEAIFWTVAAQGAARARDIARRLHVKASSVTAALQVLAEKEFIHYRPYESITLTQTGFDEATRVARRHHVLRAYFTDLLGIDESTAEQAACQLEHGIPSIVVDRLAGFHRFIKALPEEHRQCVMDFAQRCDQDIRTANAVVGQTSVADLEVGRQGVITAIKGSGSVCRRLADMGLGRGALIEIEGIAPMGSPVRVRIRGYRLALRRSEAESIVVIER